MSRPFVPPTYDTDGRSNILSPRGRGSKQGVEDALSCTSAHAWDNYSPPVELRMTFRFPSIDHHTLRMSFLSGVMLNVWNLQNIHMMWFRTKNCSFHCSYDVYNVSLGWGKCTGDNSLIVMTSQHRTFLQIFSSDSGDVSANHRESNDWAAWQFLLLSVLFFLHVILSLGLKWPRNNP